MVRKNWFWGFFVLMLVNAFAVISQAQVTTGNISGTVTDPNGAVVQGAPVTVTNLGTNASRDTTTGGNGEYAFQQLPPGRYRVEITAQGFQKYTVEAVVNITQTTTIDAQVGITADQVTVTVEPETPILQSETSQTGRVIEGETIRQLPLPTRNFQQLLTLQAGAQSSVSNNTELGRGDATISVNGQRTTSNNVRINGVDANSVGTNSTPNIAVPASDSLQEFVVQTSLYDASNGRNAGGNVEAITRSGSNQFRGSAYEFFRHNSLNANEPFIKARGLSRPELTRNQFGFMLGGPIVKDRAFFFGSYQGTREENGYSLANSLMFPQIPLGLTDTNRTAAGLASAFGLTAAQINPIALGILNARLPNGEFAIPSSGATSAPATCALGNRCPISTPISGLSTFRENQFNGNVDVNFTDNHSFSAKLFFADNPTKQANYNFAGLGNGATQLPGFGGDLTIKQKLFSFTDNYIFSSKITNQARFGFSRLRVTSVPEEPFTAAQLGITNPLANLFPGAPTISVAGIDSSFIFGSSVLADQSSRINAYSIQDTLSIVAGKHRFRVGGEYRYSTVKFYFNSFSRGQIIFPSFNSFLTGGTLAGQQGVSIIGSGVFDRSYQVNDFNAFIQDDFKVTSRLTLNLGLRYDFYGLPSDTQGRLVNFLPEQYKLGVPPNGFVQAEGGPLAGVPTVEDTLVPQDKNNFAPRIGFAYRVDDEGKIVVRGGYGLYYDRISTRYANTQLFNYPYLALGVGLPGFAFTPAQTFATPFIPIPQPSTFPTAANIPSPLAGLSILGVPISGVYVDPELETPFVHQFNIGAQWEFMKNTVLEVGYVGNRGRNLLEFVTLNAPAYNQTTNSFAPPIAAATIISTNVNATGGLQRVQTSAYSEYDSLQVTLTKRFAKGTQILGAYTYGKANDCYSGGTVNELVSNPGAPNNCDYNYGRSDFNREHRLVISGVYDLPKYNFGSKAARAILNNWQIAGIAVFQSGLPFSVTYTPGNAINNRANFAPGFTGDVELNGDVSSRLNKFFNTAAFVPSCPIGSFVGGVFVCNGTTQTGAVTAGNPNFDPNNPYGNTPRNFLTGPGQKNVDLSFIKFIPINDRFRAELRAEVFNIFNWVNYANPVSNIALGTFGQITSASTGPRVVQLGFKLNF